jgi:hypothetical protein
LARYQCYHLGDGWVRWRLLGGNNRSLGVGWSVHADLAAAVAEIGVVRSSLRLPCFEVGRADDGRWSWVLAGEDGPLARGAQSFARRVDALLAAKRFMVRAEGASVDPRLVVFEAYRSGGRAGPRERNGTS